ncbi:MAG TPA: bifunctional UDP-N-acetylglucosamine diphosphorylase/glucosamine-1-phosphate N-acetyltransferase GlmU [Egibacteraceae bacterium]|nr:bifunctional UDP-N-acetylglucosamine diphosphorylase/glucosamine-1-phosphate N-acetyltransferase GlmU [Egibacteraceae bacterium]
MTTAAVVLAAGQGTRFKSDRAKVLHAAAGRSMLRWVLEALRPLALERIVVVIGHQGEDVAAEAESAGIPALVTVRQEHQNGTGHAVRMVSEAGVLDGIDDVLVVPGDAPLLTTDVLAALLDGHRDRAASVTLLTTQLADPTGYGRVLRNGDAIAGVVEERDATDAERAITEVNTSMYVFDVEALRPALQALTTDNAQGEEYLTDVVGPLASAGATTVSAPAEVVAGVNDRSQLAAAASELRRRILNDHMVAGVTIVDPSSTYVGAEVRIEPDATLLPGTHLEGATAIGAGAAIGPDSRLVDATVEAGATVTYSVVLEASVGPRASVGPFAYLRPRARLEQRAKVGAFVEMKNSTVGEGSKVPHLSYVGDTTIGRDANIGAATVTVNYDGFNKHRTVIGDGARVGSDTMLVAPVTVGDHAYTGAGSVITKDVPPGALAVERTEQRIIEGYAERHRARSTRDSADGQGKA